MKKIGIIHGPNLNLLGKREPEIYGTLSFEAFMKQLSAEFQDLQLSYYQSNVEGELVTAIQEMGFSCDGIVLNAGAYSHSSIALADAVKAVPAPVVEVHISNIFAREEVRHHSLIGAACQGCISGFGLDGYRWALVCFSQGCLTNR